jgi:hypothetical protein
MLLTSGDLPSTELQAVALDGDVFRLDRAFCSIAEFDVPWRRASVFDERPNVVVARLSAAWVWGALPVAPHIHEVFRVAGSHSADDTTTLKVSWVAVDPSDIVDFAGVRVTSPTRSVVDLCREAVFDDDLVAVLRRLCAEHRVTRAGCDRILDRGRSFPHRRRVEARLDSLGLVLQGPGHVGVRPPG